MKNDTNAILSNVEILALAKDDPTYQRHVSEVTKDIFTTAGFEALVNNDYELLADFFALSMRVVLQKIHTPRPRIPSAYKSVVQEFSTPNGGISQRINIYGLKPTSPQYRNLQEGGSIDPFKIRKPKTAEYFFRKNLDYQNFITLQEIDLRKMFLKENGISEYIAGIMQAFDDAYAIYKYEMMREMIHNAIVSVKSPLLNTQKIQVVDVVNLQSGETSIPNERQAKWLQAFHSFATMMESTTTSGLFNAKKYEKGLYPESHTLLVRGNIWDMIKTELMATTYHTENLDIPFKVKVVKDFGGITYKNASGTAVKPVYDIYGAVKGFNTSGDPDDPLEDEADLVAVDPHPLIDAVLIENGAIFTEEQNGYQVDSINNPSGRYTNYFASKPNGSINYDACYNLVYFHHAAPTNKNVEANKEKEANKK